MWENKFPPFQAARVRSGVKRGGLGVRKDPTIPTLQAGGERHQRIAPLRHSRPLSE